MWVFSLTNTIHLKNRHSSFLHHFDQEFSRKRNTFRERVLENSLDSHVFTHSKKFLPIKKTSEKNVKNKKYGQLCLSTNQMDYM